MKEEDQDPGEGDGNSSSPPVSISLYRVELTPLQKQILAIADGFMQRHYLLDLKELHKEARRALKSETPDSIRYAISGLISKHVIFDGKALTRERALENETRSRIMELITKNPGSNFSTIRNEVGKDSRTVQFHLDILARFAFIRAEEFGNNVAYFENSLGKDYDSFLYYLQKNDAKDIFGVILNHQGITMNELQEHFGSTIPRSSLYRKIRILVDNGCIIENHDANQQSLFDIPDHYCEVLRKYLFS
jgi:predicted transcriptional regulator